MHFTKCRRMHRYSMKILKSKITGLIFRLPNFWQNPFLRARRPPSGGKVLDPRRLADIKPWPPISFLHHTDKVAPISPGNCAVIVAKQGLPPRRTAHRSKIQKANWKGAKRKRKNKRTTVTNSFYYFIISSFSKRLIVRLLPSRCQRTVCFVSLFVFIIYPSTYNPLSMRHI